MIDQTDARIATVALPAELDCVGGNCELPAGRVKADTDFVVFSAFPARHLKYAREGDIREGGGQGAHVKATHAGLAAYDYEADNIIAGYMALPH